MLTPDINRRLEPGKIGVLVEYRSEDGKVGESEAISDVDLFLTNEKIMR